MKDEWTESYALVMPMLGVVLAAIGVSLSLLALRSQAQGVSGMQPPTGVDVDVPKVRYSDGNVFVEVRRPGEWHAITDFVKLNDPAVTRAIMGVL